MQVQRSISETDKTANSLRLTTISDEFIIQIDFYSWVLKIVVRWFLNKQIKRVRHSQISVISCFIAQQVKMVHLKARSPQQRARFEECLEHK